MQLHCKNNHMTPTADSMTHVWLVKFVDETTLRFEKVIDI